jgi:hypothetical protein
MPMMNKGTNPVDESGKKLGVPKRLVVIGEGNIFVFRKKSFWGI